MSSPSGTASVSVAYGLLAGLPFGYLGVVFGFAAFAALREVHEGTLFFDAVDAFDAFGGVGCADAARNIWRVGAVVVRGCLDDDCICQLHRELLR